MVSFIIMCIIISLGILFIPKIMIGLFLLHISMYLYTRKLEKIEVKEKKKEY